MPWLRPLLAALLLCGARGGHHHVAHATFGRAHGMALCRRFACREDDVRATTTVAQARLALEHPSAFAVASEDGGRIVLFVLLPVGRHIHRVDAVMWHEGAHPPERYRALRAWHAARYAKHVLIPGDALSEDDQRAWDEDEA